MKIVKLKHNKRFLNYPLLLLNNYNYEIQICHNTIAYTIDGTQLTRNTYKNLRCIILLKAYEDDCVYSEGRYVI